MPRDLKLTIVFLIYLVIMTAICIAFPLYLISINMLSGSWMWLCVPVYIFMTNITINYKDDGKANFSVNERDENAS